MQYCPKTTKGLAEMMKRLSIIGEAHPPQVSNKNPRHHFQTTGCSGLGFLKRILFLIGNFFCTADIAVLHTYPVNAFCR